jgi:hypothetical protein
MKGRDAFLLLEQPSIFMVVKSWLLFIFGLFNDALSCLNYKVVGL